MQFWSFVFGLAVGSFLNVLSFRYDPARFIFAKKIIGGRSFCPHCRNKLNWFELIPFLSFLFLRARCRSCHEKISWQYPIVELISGLIFVFVPLGVDQFLSPITYHLSPNFYLLSTFYVLIFLTLLLVTLIDIRLRLIPDEANLFLIILGLALIFLASPHFGLIEGSFLGPSAAIFGLRDSIWLNRLVAFLFGALFFGALVLITRGRGMGLGDLKLAAALGVVFGWPDIILITALSFILGSIFSFPGLILGKRKMKSFLPFGPFLALASLVVFFFGQDLMAWYFGLFNLV